MSPSAMEAVPVLDLRRDDGDRDALVAEAGRAYREFGFCGFSHHGIDPALVSAARSAFAEFFALPEEAKQAYAVPGLGGQRGYTGFGRERARGRTVPDLKEFWHVGREVRGDNPHPDVLVPNVWPGEVPGFRERAEALYEALDALGRRILRIIASALGLPADWFDDKVDYGNSILRPIHYPPLGEAETPAIRAAEHEDINLITLLLGSEQEGLQILTRDGRWIPVTTIPGGIVVNIGDMMQRLTNHALPSTTHRVVNPKGEVRRTSRYSIPFFLHPNPDFEIRTLPGCVTPDNPDRYPQPVVSIDFLNERLREIGLL